MIGCVGRLVEVKDYPTHLRALALLRARGVAFEGVIAGTGPLRAELTALAESLQLTNVRFLGNRDDVEQVLGSFDLFVLSSSSEGLSNTIQEAMSTGLPVVATRVGGADELVDDSTGVLVPSRDPQALADAIHAMAVQPDARARMGAAGRARAKTAFGIDRMLREYEALYRASGGGAPAVREVPIHEA